MITYRARVILSDIGSANQTQQIPIHNRAEMEGYSQEVNKTAEYHNSGEGTASNPMIRLMKYQAGDMTKRLSGAVFQLLDAEKNPIRDKNGQDVTFTTDENGMIAVQGHQEELGWTLQEDTRY